MNRTDRSQDFLGYERRPLESFFSPKVVAVIGASERRGSVGRTLMENLSVLGDRAEVFPVNPKHARILGHKSYASPTELPRTADLAVIAIPAASVPEAVRSCTEAGIKAAVIVSAGFRETGPKGARLEKKILEIARGKIRIIGPNCLGIMRPATGLNATFARSAPKPGRLGFISQSGALMSSILDWSLRENVGFSVFVSAGSMVDVGWGDLIDYLGSDPETRSILLYMESVGDARSFLSAAREVALTKPIIILKAGRTEAAAKAATSHTGALAANDRVLDAAFRRAGVLRVDTIGELFDMAEVLGKQPRPEGSRLMIVTNAGGPGVLATDRLIAGGGTPAVLSSDTEGRLNDILPAYWSHANPVDVLGDADPERYGRVAEVVGNDPGGDGMLVILTPQEMTNPTKTAKRIALFARGHGRPLLASWMGGEATAEGVRLLNDAGVPTFEYPDDAAQAFNLMWRYSKNLKRLYETPVWPAELGKRPDPAHAAAVVEKALKKGSTLLNEIETKEILAGWGIPVTETRAAATADDAVRIAGGLGYPVVLKVLSPDVTHKTDVGGIRLDLKDPDDVRQAFDDIRKSLQHARPQARFEGVSVQPMVTGRWDEAIVGSSADRDFGPVLLFGSGGRQVEVYRDTALALPPLTTILARQLMEETRIFRALSRPRGGSPDDLDALTAALVRFSWLVSHLPRLREIEINPLLVSPEGVLAVDARAVLYDPDVSDASLPHPAIRPYPLEQVSHFRLKDGLEAVLRPIRPEDEPLMVAFDREISDQNVYSRYFESVSLSQRIAHERLARICFVDYDREIVLVAEIPDGERGRRIIGVGRLVRLKDRIEGEFALQIADRFQGQGLGTRLLERLVLIGRSEGIRRIYGVLLHENHRMRRVAEKVGFHIARDPEENALRAELLN